MKPHLRYAVAGSLVIASLSASPIWAAPAAGAADPVPPEQAIKTVIANAIRVSISDDGLKRVLEDVGSHDRTRIEANLDPASESQFATHATALRKFFREKYKAAFDPTAIGSFANAFKIELEKDGARAAVVIPPLAGEPKFTLHLRLEEGGVWRIEVPNALTAPAYEKAMLSGVTTIEAREDKMPRSIEKAYDEVAAEMLHSLTAGGS